MTIVAISRELGSGGNTIAAAVAKALNYEFVDREIVLRAAQAHGIPAEKIAAADEHRLSVWQRFNEERRRYLAFIEAAYLSFAERGNVVTAGRGGPFFLREVSHAVKVKLMAPFDVRIRRVMEQDHVDHKTASARVRTYHRDLCGRIDYLFGLDWTQPENYDLVINTRDDAWPFYTDLLVAVARHPRYQPTPDSLQQIHDLSLAAQVRAAIADAPVTQHLHLEVSARAGRVALKGVVFSPATLDAAAETARRVPGVTQVTCEVVAIPSVDPGPIV